jgi:hypothetical protein
MLTCCHALAKDILDQLIVHLGQYHYVVALANAFFSKDLMPESQDQCSFTCQGRQWTFLVLPQGYMHNPTLWHIWLPRIWLLGHLLVYTWLIMLMTFYEPLILLQNQKQQWYLCNWPYQQHQSART